MSLTLNRIIAQLFLYILLTLSSAKYTISKEKMTLGPKQSNFAYGIDISEFQGHINWDQMSRSGIEFVYIRASEGITIRDHKFQDNWQSAKRLDLLRGAYHFYIVGDEVSAQLKNFISQFTLEAGDLAPMIDIEHASLVSKEAINKSSLQENFIRFLGHVESTFGCSPIIYTSHSFASEYLDDYRFAEYRLWIADYNKSKPSVPDVWKKKGWFIWQFMVSEDFPGVNTNNGRVDQDMSSLEKGLFRKRAKCIQN